MIKLQTLIQKYLPRWDKVILLGVFVYFFLQLCFYATSVAPGIAPDEIYHIKLSLLFSKYNGLFMPESPATYELNTVSTVPFLYHFLLGKLVLLNFFKIPSILYLRFINIILSLLTVLFSYKFFQFVAENKVISLLGIIVLTNVPMFSFLSAFASYDNLANLLSVLSFYYLFKYFKLRVFRHLLVFFATGLSGLLTKISFIPLLAILLALYMHDLFRNYKGKTRNVTLIKDIGPISILLILIILVLTILNYRLYVSNILKYGTFAPGCTDVLTYQQCQKNENFNTYEKIKEYTAKTDKTHLLGVHDYFFYWKNMIERGIFGIFGHNFMIRTSEDLLPYNFLMLLFLFFLCRYFNSSDNILLTYSLASSLTYIAIIFYRVQYSKYKAYGLIGPAVQGRYLFPIIFPTIVLFCYYLLNFVKTRTKFLIFVVTSIIFLWGCLPYFVRYADRSWYVDFKINNIWHIESQRLSP